MGLGLRFEAAAPLSDVVSITGLVALDVDALSLLGFLRWRASLVFVCSSEVRSVDSFTWLPELEASNVAFTVSTDAMVVANSCGFRLIVGGSCAVSATSDTDFRPRLLASLPAPDDRRGRVPGSHSPAVAAEMRRASMEAAVFDFAEGRTTTVSGSVPEERFAASWFSAGAGSGVPRSSLRSSSQINTPRRIPSIVITIQTTTSAYVSHVMLQGDCKGVAGEDGIMKH